MFELGVTLGFTDDIYAMSLGSRPYAIQIREARQSGEFLHSAIDPCPLHTLGP